ncbi:alpha-ketoglutarate-dependent dioxygenase AlkB family protein [Flocculibacter collagenilyticus]|uniref:alpha-ketoglutarate-dependent dioxygenase AlkB family protein n=1 Tax=Flocculibacter collagenilyticus TaxID=2744479 RepID=UPI0018F28BAA|nr:alpha-ketoglutarate-dependent dioxygenase AlkB [Flocculibacter collagenilyticus]
MALKKLHVEDGILLYDAHFLSETEVEALTQECDSKIHWQQPSIKMFGKSVKIPRLQAWLGDEDAVYKYSGTTFMPESFTPEVTKLKQRIEAVTAQSFNSVLINKYRNGQDSMGWHSDNEKELGDEPTIASVTIGQPRVFELQHKQSKEMCSILLASGSLLIMAGSLQTHWKHRINKSRHVNDVRINFTFRTVKK